jgi:proton-dependent oligopeptide transporter, POT family
MSQPPHQQQSSSSSSSPSSPPVSSSSLILTLKLEDLPSNVSTVEQLRSIPETFQSHKHHEPLKHVDEDTGEVFTYALKPMSYAVLFILSVELLERFSYYGLVYTQTSYLTGVYDHSHNNDNNDTTDDEQEDDGWSAKMTAVGASSYVSVAIAMGYTAPFLGALLADSFIGDYWSIVVGCTCFYLPGLFLIVLTTIPHVLGSWEDEFPTRLLALGLLVLWPIGTGIVKSVINVFGAKQFHPILQSRCIESYYVSFYMCINIGSLAGGLTIPIVAQHNITVAYLIPVVALSTGLLIFLTGTPRYCIAKPRGDLISTLCPSSSSSSSYSSPMTTSPGTMTMASATTTTTTTSLWSVLQLCCLIIPFNIVYSQQATMFIVQGTVMRKAFGFLDAPSMNNADSISVLVFGTLIGQKMYPWLAQRNIKIATTHKFAIGSALGAMAISWAMLVEHLIHVNYYNHIEKGGSGGGGGVDGDDDGDCTISVLWQLPSYILVGAGEIFAISTAYETAFTVAPPQKKALASAINIFCIGGIPNVLCLILYQICSSWFRNSVTGSANIHTLESYAHAKIGHYFRLLLGIACLGILLNLLPRTKKFVEQLEDVAVNAIKTPRMTPTPARPPLARQRKEMNSPTTTTTTTITTTAVSEHTPLLLVHPPTRRPTTTKKTTAVVHPAHTPIVFVNAGSFHAAPFLQDPSEEAKNTRQAEKNRMSFLMRLKRKETIQQQIATAQAPPVLLQRANSLQQQQQQQQQQQPQVQPKQPPNSDS